MTSGATAAAASFVAASAFAARSSAGATHSAPSANAAAIKAFVVNRVGDFGFLLGIGLIAAYAGTLSYTETFAKADELSKIVFPYDTWGGDWMLITVICICLFIGAMGKSAQFPLHVWLPDAMEGPTPISALIHAATMVTAGIFMVARMSPLFEGSDTALAFILFIGATTENPSFELNGALLLELAQARDHLARVAGMDAVVLGRGLDIDPRIGLPGLKVLIRGIALQHGPLGRNGRIAVLGERF